MADIRSRRQFAFAGPAVPLPDAQPAALEYLKRSVKLEFGSLTDQRPTASHAVRPLIANVLPDAFADRHCDVVALDLHRAFWEKATILHAEHHRPADKPTPDRFARHYADMAALALHAEASGAITQSELRDRVVHWKSRRDLSLLYPQCVRIAKAK